MVNGHYGQVTDGRVVKKAPFSLADEVIVKIYSLYLNTEQESLMFWVVWGIFLRRPDKTYKCPDLHKANKESLFPNEHFQKRKLSEKYSLPSSSAPGISTS